MYKGRCDNNTGAKVFGNEESQLRYTHTLCSSSENWQKGAYVVLD
jgi:hypothetical protein